MWSHILDRARIAYTWNTPQSNMGNRLSLCVAVFRGYRGICKTIWRPKYGCGSGFNDSIRLFEPDLPGLKSLALPIYKKYGIPVAAAYQAVAAKDQAILREGSGRPGSQGPGFQQYAIPRFWPAFCGELSPSSPEPTARTTELMPSKMTAAHRPATPSVKDYRLGPLSL